MKKLSLSTIPILLVISLISFSTSCSADGSGASSGTYDGTVSDADPGIEYVIRFTLDGVEHNFVNSKEEEYIDPEAAFRNKSLIVAGRAAAPADSKYILFSIEDVTDTGEYQSSSNVFIYDDDKDDFLIKALNTDDIIYNITRFEKIAGLEDYEGIIEGTFSGTIDNDEETPVIIITDGYVCVKLVSLDHIFPE